MVLFDFGSYYYYAMVLILLGTFDGFSLGYKKQKSIFSDK